MFYSYHDIIKLEKFNKDKPVTERENSKILLEEMASYAESSVCRRKQLLHYFGEVYDDPYCNDTKWCDNCRYPRDRFQGMDEIQLVLNTVLQTQERFGIKHLVHVITGVNSQYVQSYRHNELPLFGSGKDKGQEFWSSIIRQAMLLGFLKKDIENVGVIKMNPKGRSYLDEPFALELTKDHDYGREEEPSITDETISRSSYDEALFELLKGLRKKVAKQKGLPPYVIFQDPSLEEMAIIYPTTKEELSQINGVGQGKVAKFGQPFIDAIKHYVIENDITTASDVVIKSAVDKSKNKIYIIQQIDRKVDLEEIAESKNMKMEDLLGEIEQICYSGTKLNLDYYVEQIMDYDRQDDLYDYFLNAETDSIAEALQELEDEDYSEEELRLMRIKFLSEYAN
jgi:ATP-dependent DNA helicase RecQ